MSLPILPGTGTYAPEDITGWDVIEMTDGSGKCRRPLIKLGAVKYVTGFDQFLPFVDLINGKFALPTGTPAVMDLIRKEISQAARNIHTALQKATSEGSVRVSPLMYELGLVELQAAKDKLVAAIIVPHHPGTSAGGTKS